MNRKPNRLIHSASLYLRQHAYNPVDWYEWGEEALGRAQAENKPVIVSIGYSSCHWCHVMERECFEHPELAAMMNWHFICIKVDREERPDIDQVYMDAIQAMGLSGGWPLNVFLTPDQKPFYGGTYFPPRLWKQVLNGIAEAWQNRRDEIEQSAAQLTQHLRKDFSSSLHQTSAYHASQAWEKLKSKIDMRFGGLAKAPKFIIPSVWRWLLCYHYLTHDSEPLKQVSFTLHQIAAGGIYDHIGGGFARYSVDEKWFAPHFEKMLYDNAQLIALYSEAWMVTRDDRFREVVYETIDWLNREMSNPQGGFYSAIDADSEGEEGKFYTWTYSDFCNALGNEADKWASFFHVLPEGNWEEGRNILYRKPGEKNPADYERIRHNLLTYRNRRVRPVCDKKLLTAWNAMTLSALATAYKAFGEKSFYETAVGGMHFLRSRLYDGKRLMRSWNEGPSAVEGFLDDYACTIRACIDLHQISLNEDYLRWAQQLTDKVLNDFSDAVEPFFFYTSAHAEQLIARKKEIFDNVIPASNSIMAENLLILGRLLDRQDYASRARTMLEAAAAFIQEEPVYMSNWGLALLRLKAVPCEAVLDDAEPGQTLQQLNQAFHPFVLYARSSESGVIPLAQGKRSQQKPAIFICPGNSCLAPVYEVQKAMALLAIHAPAFSKNFV